MPGGKNNITGNDGKKFSSSYQPKNRRRSTKFLSDLLTKELKRKEEIIIEGLDPETRKPVKVIIIKPTREQIIQALIRKAAKGDIYAIKEIFDRIEGKAKQEVDISAKIDYSKLSDEDLDYIINELTKKAV